ncbi:MAG TPA: L-serine ammonia-lyase, iron-sulfur-dependent subunit beta [Candidatus Lachnoclostridium stercoravium]|uniref:L-serine deaminase n=1 Tax=Candidatus Lachnoclostridium stercoravium TaxID=2838633 RepID=A0A9D2KNS7_9FIRM|nr:L-serine ammonia-lyase, iron-sulfur-dependent subunit beta [Candidatus Lachnoclostridium stercoravium]
MSFISVFDVLGPNMIGPSSSHTAGAAIIAFLAQKMISPPLIKVDFTLYGSFAKTYKGHGTDRALLGGIMGFSADDTRIRDSFRIAEERGLEFSFTPNEEETEVYPNTVDISMENEAGRKMVIRGESLGGGKVRIVRINQVKVEFTGEYSAVIVIHQDKPGVAAHITKCLSDMNINIAFMRLFRKGKGAIAYTIVESDERLPVEIGEKIRENANVHEVMIVQT